jgi:hypothetical protein
MKAQFGGDMAQVVTGLLLANARFEQTVGDWRALLTGPGGRASELSLCWLGQAGRALTLLCVCECEVLCE